MIAAIYPTIIPIRMEDELSTPLVQCLKNSITTSTRHARSRFSAEPKSDAELPPPKELIPTPISDNPMESTTVPVTTDGKKRRNGFKNAPRTVSMKPPMIEAPMMAPYPKIPPPIMFATLLNTPINPELVPMMIGTFPPIGPIANSWINVTIPAMIIAFCSNAT